MRKLCVSGISSPSCIDPISVTVGLNYTHKRIAQRLSVCVYMPCNHVLNDLCTLWDAWLLAAKHLSECIRLMACWTTRRLCVHCNETSHNNKRINHLARHETQQYTKYSLQHISIRLHCRESVQRIGSGSAHFGNIPKQGLCTRTATK